MNMQKIRSAIDEDFEGFCKDCFAHWITCLWGKYRPEFSFEENKEAFFYLVERLLREGKAKFADPDGDGSTLWDAAPDVVVEHLRSGWPKDADTEGSPLIVSYFYDDWNRCPPIFWLDDDGQWHGS